MLKNDKIRGVSVCIATYNGAKYIRNQINSILMQLTDEDELIISDDGSFDGTLEILQTFRDDRIKIIFNEYKGVISNFENTLRKARGEIIFLADQDDIWLPNKIQMHLGCHKNYDLVLSDAEVINEDGAVLYDSFIKERHSKVGLWHNMIKNSYIGCCMSFNRKVLEKSLPFPIDIPMHDWWIGLIAEKFGHAHILPVKTLRYLRHNNNASQTLEKTLPLTEQIKNRAILVINLLKRK